MKRLSILIFTLISTLCVQARQLVTEYSKHTGYPLWHITNMLQDNDSLIWISTWNGLYRFDGYELVNFKANVGDSCDMHSDRFRNILLSDNGDIYCLVEGQIFLFHRNTYKYEQLNDYQNDSILRLMRTRRNSTITIRKPVEVNGTRLNVNRGMKDLQGNSWYFNDYELYKVVEEEEIGKCEWRGVGIMRSLFVDSRGRKWMGTKMGELMCDDGSGVLKYLSPDGKLTKESQGMLKSVYCVAEVPTGTLWFGTKGNGLYRLRGEVLTNYCMNNSNLSSDKIYDIKIDEESRMWIATYGGGLACIQDPERDDIVITSSIDGSLNYPLFLPPKLRQIIVLDNKLMIGTHNGLLKVNNISNSLDKLQYVLYKRDSENAQSLTKDVIMGITMVSPDTICVATESGGLNFLNINDNDARFRHMGKGDKLNEEVTLTAFMDNGKLWVVCPNKLVSIYNGKVENYNVSRDIGNTFLNEMQAVHNFDGTWSIGTDDGIFNVNLSKLRKSSYEPRIIISKAQIQNRPALYTVSCSDTLYLGKDERNLTLYFAALDYGNTDAIHYAYRLNGKGDWVNIEGRTVTFLDMDAGKTELQVRSTNNNGEWVDNVKTFTILVKPKIYETPFYIGLLLFLFSSVGVAMFLLHKYLYKKRLKRYEVLDAYLELLDKEDKQRYRLEKIRRERDKSQKEAANDSHLKWLMKYIEANVGNTEISLDDMAKAVELTPDALSRKTHEILGLSPDDLLKHARMRAACNMLMDETLRISDIATMCGYNDPKLFARCFKQTMGITPTEYRDGAE
ncbi:MAG: helix-turn-helix domain-containing protein [Bacteroidales bacterium]|nr:helix-turn-helix domain-containing protein [Bacteroidales bacterium]